MKDSIARDQGFPKKWDQTMFRYSCKRKFYLWYLRRLDYRITPPYFIWGQAWQEQLSSWYGHPELDYEERINLAISVGQKHWEDSGTLEGKYDKPDSLRTILMFYSLQYEFEPFEIVALDNKVELGFEIPFPPRPEILICGAVDGYINWPSFGPMVLENKSSGMDVYQQRYLNQWKYDPQPMTYYWALSETIGEEPYGVLMNLTSKKVTQAMLKAFQSNGEIPAKLFCRDIIRKSQFNVQEFYRSVSRSIEDFERQWDQWEWPKTYDVINCVGGIGKSPCPYQKLCLMEADPWELEDDEILIEGLEFKDEPWAPWERGE